jgi:hypothetical protein
VSERKTPEQKRTELREAIWPESEKWTWCRHGEKGFITIPRLLPWITHALKFLAKGSKTGDPSPAYIELWCRSFDYGLVTVKNDEECAYAAGYSGNRALRTWSAHMTKLVDLGFILASRDGNREFGQVLLLNPLAVVAALNEKSKLPEGWWTSFVGRANDIGTTLPKALKLPKDVKRMK